MIAQYRQTQTKNRGIQYNMNLQDKVDAIFSHLESSPISDPHSFKVLADAQQSSRKEMTDALIETINSGDLSYEEATVRVNASTFSKEDQNIILAQISHFDGLVKKASEKPMEAEEMKPVNQEVEDIKAVLPHYGAWLEGVLKQSQHLGTGGKPKEDSVAAAAFKNDAAQIQQGIAAGKAQTTRTDAKTNPNKRLEESNAMNTKNAGAETYNNKHEDLRESEVANHKTWDKNVLDQELAAAKSGEGAQASRAKELQKRREEYLRAANKLAVKFSTAANAWIIEEKATSIPVVIASISDIVSGNQITGAALDDLKSAKFGEIIMDDVKNNGVITAAKNLLGEVFEKLAAEQLSNVKTAGINTEKLQGKIDTLKGIYASVEESLGSLTKTASIQNLLKKAVDGINKADEALALGDTDGAAEGIADAAGPLGTGNSVAILSSGDADAAATDLGITPEEAQPITEQVLDIINVVPETEKDAKIQEVIDALEAEKSTSVKEESEASEAVAEASGASVSAASPEASEASAADTKKKNPFAKGNSAASASEASEVSVAAANRVLVTSMSEASGSSEGGSSEVSGASKSGSGILNALKKLGAKDCAEYDVTKGLNWLAEGGHKGSKGPSQDGKSFMTIETLRSAFEPMATQKAKGTVHSFDAAVNMLMKAAKSSGMSVEEYWKKATSPAYGKAMTHEYTQSEIVKEHAANTKDNNVYAAGAQRMKIAMELTSAMTKKGMIDSKNPEQVNSQVSDLMNMDEKTLSAYASSIERLAPSTELEEGRFRVQALAKPDKDGNIVVGFVDGKEVAYMTGEDIESPTGKVTKANLINAIGMMKQALNEGVLEEALTGVAQTSGLNDLGGLDLGQGTQAKPVIDFNDLY